MAATQSGHVMVSRASELCFEHSFIEAFRSQESSLLRAVNIGEAGQTEILQGKVGYMTEILQNTVGFLL